MTADETSLIIPVDGSLQSLHATQYVADAIKKGLKAAVHLLNVQPPVSGNVSNAIRKETIDSYHREEAEKALAGAKTLLDNAGIPYKLHIGVGDPGEVVAAYVEKLNCSQIIMGSRGLGATFGLVLGSVASNVVKKTTVPVTLVK
jgi:nucleotide-binding universal stress UspA family protein